MKLQLKTKLQRDIADLLWAAKDLDHVNRIVAQFGPDAVTVRDLMIAHELDQYTEVEEAEQVLNQFRSK